MRAVFVDGANLSWMRKPLGIGQFDFKGLFETLQFIGNDPMMGRPVYTINGNVESIMGKSLRNAGFEVTIVESRNDKDDKFIIERIDNLNRELITEIVLVSADQDYVECLRRHTAQGVKVFWVATRYLGTNGSMVSPMVSESSEFIFVELADHKDKIMRTPWEDRVVGKGKVNGESDLGGESTHEPHKFVKVTLSATADSEEVANILKGVIGLIAKFPQIKYTIEG